MARRERGASGGDPPPSLSDRDVGLAGVDWRGDEPPSLPRHV